MKRMKELTQSQYFTIDDIVRNEFDINTSKRSIQVVISFIFINIHIQEHSFIDQITSQSSSTVNNLDIISNITFDLKRFLSDLETIIFERDETEKDISVDQVLVDSQFKQIVLVFFNENDVIMRRIIEYDYDERKINVKNETYRVYCEAFLKTKNIIYRRD